LAQSFKDFDLLLVDDGSPDRCGEICDEYAKQDKRIHVTHLKNAGLSAARNTGIDWSLTHSNSEWLSFIDSDDYVHPHYLESLYGAVIKNGVVISACNYVMTNGEALSVDQSNVIAKNVMSKQYYCNSAVPATVAWGKLYQKKLFDNIRFPVGRYHEDEFTTYKLLFKCKKLAIISQPLYAYYQNPNGITHSVSWRKLSVDKIDALAEQIEYFRANHFITAEMQRLMICMDKFRQVEKHAKLFSEKDLLHIQEFKKNIIKQYPGLLSFYDFIKRHNAHKSLHSCIFTVYNMFCFINKYTNNIIYE
jgi:glycosyltransferase involved in cell wall biosynthesis